MLKMPKKSQQPRVFFDVEIGSEQAGRIVFELFSEKCPKTAENFRCLCTGERGIGSKTGKPLHYKGVKFHRVIRDFMVQAGDFSEGNGKGGESIYGGFFDDENFDIKHDSPFLLSMANRGPNTNGSQFFITTQNTPHLNNKHVVFGRVVSGEKVVKQIENQAVDASNQPIKQCSVVHCGELVLAKKSKKAKHTSDSESVSAASDEEKTKKKHKKKKSKHKKHKKKKSKKNKDVDKENQSANEEDAESKVFSTISAEEVPDIPENKFLARTTASEKSSETRTTTSDRDRPKGKHWVSRSGRKVKGRGTLRYRTPSRSRSRSPRGRRGYNRRSQRDSQTPPHWRAAMRDQKPLNSSRSNGDNDRWKKDSSPIDDDNRLVSGWDSNEEFKRRPGIDESENSSASRESSFYRSKARNKETKTSKNKEPKEKSKKNKRKKKNKKSSQEKTSNVKRKDKKKKHDENLNPVPKSRWDTDEETSLSSLPVHSAYDKSAEYVRGLNASYESASQQSPILTLEKIKEIKMKQRNLKNSKENSRKNKRSRWDSSDENLSSLHLRHEGSPSKSRSPPHAKTRSSLSSFASRSSNSSFVIQKSPLIHETTASIPLKVTVDETGVVKESTEKLIAPTNVKVVTKKNKTKLKQNEELKPPKKKKVKKVKDDAKLPWQPPLDEELSEEEMIVATITNPDSNKRKTDEFKLSPWQNNSKKLIEIDAIWPEEDGTKDEVEKQTIINVALPPKQEEVVEVKQKDEYVKKLQPTVTENIKVKSVQEQTFQKLKKKSNFSTNNFSVVVDDKTAEPKPVANNFGKNKLNEIRNNEVSNKKEEHQVTSSSESELELIAKPPPSKKTITFNIKINPPMPPEEEQERAPEPKPPKKKRKHKSPTNPLERVALMLKKKRKQLQISQLEQAKISSNEHKDENTNSTKVDTTNTSDQQPATTLGQASAVSFAINSNPTVSHPGRNNQRQNYQQMRYNQYMYQYQLQWMRTYGYYGMMPPLPREDNSHQPPEPKEPVKLSADEIAKMFQSKEISTELLNSDLAEPNSDKTLPSPARTPKRNRESSQSSSSSVSSRSSSRSYSTSSYDSYSSHSSYSRNSRRRSTRRSRSYSSRSRSRRSSSYDSRRSYSRSSYDSRSSRSSRRSISTNRSYSSYSSRSRR